MAMTHSAQVVQQPLPHMNLVAWDTLEMLMEHFAADYPEHFSLQRQGDAWTRHNRALDVRDSFVFGDNDNLAMEPFAYITRQAQGDWAMLDQRDGDLYLDAGMVAGPADWSLGFDLRMSFKEWHGPVPLAHEMGVFDHALNYLLNMQVERPARCLNRAMSINALLEQASVICRVS